MTGEEMLAGRRILVTGGAGFIGSHLCEALLKRGAAVLCVGDFSSGQQENVAHLLACPRFELLQHDVCNPLAREVDEIYNLACPASPSHYRSDPVKTIRTSLLGAVNMLELARQCGARVLQASSGDVYGTPLAAPLDESYWGRVDPIGPRASYVEGKRCAEALCFDYRRQHGTQIKVARIFNTFGPRMSANDGRVVSTFIVQALRGEALTLYGAGDQVRSFCYVSDLVDGLIRLMASADEVTGPVNLGSPHATTIRELAETIVRHSGSRSRIDSSPLPVDDSFYRIPDIALAGRLLGWAPEVSMTQGLDDTIAYFKEKSANLPTRL